MYCQFFGGISDSNTPTLHQQANAIRNYNDEPSFRNKNKLQLKSLMPDSDI